MAMQKIVRTDNYARETVSDHLVCENIDNERYATIMLEALRSARRSDEVWFKLQPQEQPVYKFDHT